MKISNLVEKDRYLALFCGANGQLYACGGSWMLPLDMAHNLLDGQTLRLFDNKLLDGTKACELLLDGSSTPRLKLVYQNGSTLLVDVADLQGGTGSGSLYSLTKERIEDAPIFCGSYDVMLAASLAKALGIKLLSSIGRDIQKTVVALTGSCGKKFYLCPVVRCQY